MKIILLHGALGAADQLVPLANALQEEGYDPVILELPGHGKSALGEYNFSIDDFSSWLEETIEEKKLWGLPFFGFSMGGYIMLYLLTRKKYDIGPVIILGTKFNWNKESARSETGRLNPDTILEKVPKFAQMLNERHKDWRKVLLNTSNLMSSLGDEPLLSRKNVHNINQQVLILRGEADNMVDEKESLEIADSLSNGQYKILSGLPHPLEQIPPGELVKAIKAFI